MDRSRFNLCPRGYGRSSYHLAETIQMGRVPVYLYDDTAWIPYEKLFRRRIGYGTDVRGLPRLLRRLSRTSDSELAVRERAAAALRVSHFTLPGVMEQISRFMTAPETADLQCRKLPRTVRGR